MTITGLPGDLENVKVNIYNKGHGQKNTIATDATPGSDGKVSLDDGASVASDVTYTVQISSSNYADLSTTVKVDSETPEPEPGEQKTAPGEASVGSYGYNAKVIVTYDPTTGKIVSVQDNGTAAAGNNATFWNMLTGNTYSGKKFWEQFEGLTAEGVRALKINPTGMIQNSGTDNVDAVSGATYSSKAVQEAVLDALSD